MHAHSPIGPTALALHDATGAPAGAFLPAENLQRHIGECGGGFVMRHH
jgi:hypothetical protein